MSRYFGAMLEEMSDHETRAKRVTLSPEDVRQAIRLLQRLTGPTRRVSDRSVEVASRDALSSVAQLSLAVRQERNQHFSPAMFGEPAWDLLLALYVEQAENEAPTVSMLAKVAGIPITTALRWMDYLEEKRLIERERSSFDRRASTVTLSESGRTRLEGYFAEVLVALDGNPQAIQIPNT
jgi:DNA-binding MarR family transcriptional regulator